LTKNKKTQKQKEKSKKIKITQQSEIFYWLP